MKSGKRQNPYETLQLSAKASMHEVIERSKKLSSETMDRKLQMDYRLAAEEIRQHPVRRAINQFWEPPETCYEDEILEHFCARHRRPPVTARSLSERKKRFVDEDCSPRNLACLALPSIPIPDVIGSFELAEVPQEEPNITLESWELFY